MVTTEASITMLLVLEITQKCHNHLGLGVTHRRSWRAKLDQ
jgi:hypothetical protein